MEGCLRHADQRVRQWTRVSSRVTPARRTTRRSAARKASRQRGRNLLGRRHHPLAWTALVALIPLVSTLVLILWPWLRGAGALVVVGHLHARG
jgi:Flp pilus assembly protein TadB